MNKIYTRIPTTFIDQNKTSSPKSKNKFSTIFNSLPGMNPDNYLNTFVETFHEML